MEGRIRWDREVNKRTLVEAETENCTLCKKLQHQVRLWTKRIEL